MALANNLLSIVNDRIKLFVDNLAENEEQKTQMLSMWFGEESTHLQLTCRHVKSGGGLCDKKVSDKSISRKYCFDHLFKEIPIKDIPPITGDKKTVNLLQRIKLNVIETISGYLVHPDTNLVFDADKLVVGKEVNGVVIPLEAEDLNFCSKQKIKTKLCM
jgi:hypothetical protein